MAETDSKTLELAISLLSLSLGVLGALIGSGISVCVFMWKEGRSKYQKELAASRVLVLLVKNVSEIVNHGVLTDIELKPELLIACGEPLMHNDEAMDVVSELIEIIARIRHGVTQANNDGCSQVKDRLENTVNRATKQLKRKQNGLRKFIYLLW